MTESLPPAERPVPARPEDAVPPLRAQRDRLRQQVDEHVRAAGVRPPLSRAELAAHVERFLAHHQADLAYRHYAAVLLHNAVWRERVAHVPFDRRLLLLPQCLRAPEVCRGEKDPLGLLCRHCGSCLIDPFAAQAQKLGYAVLAAEGTTAVTALLASGRIEAVVGVSCLSVLERVFPYVNSAGVPGLAIPLLRDGCVNTAVDSDWVWEAICLSADETQRSLDLDALRSVVDGWFAPEELERSLPACEGQTGRIARSWLSRSGKRWRPLLAAGAYAALAGAEPHKLGDDIRRLALAVECFHKASLAHDDIEDNDASRYGQMTLHEEYGLPVALNTGDFLLGEGYRLIAACGLDDSRRVRMLTAAADGHRRLALGQGAELCWRRQPRPLAPAEVLEIFRGKTAPAFDVALQLGAICAGADEALCGALTDYSRPLGIAYQIRDDLDDFFGGEHEADARAMRPSVLLALAYEASDGADRRLLEAAWRGQLDVAAQAAPLEALLERLDVPARAAGLLEQHREQALLSLRRIEPLPLQRLLHQVLGRIFSDLDMRELQRELERTDDQRRRASGGSAA